MAKLVKLTSNIDLDLPASKFDLRSWKMWREPTFIFYFEYFGVLNVEIGKEMGKLRISAVFEVSGGHLEVMIW